MKKIIVAVFYLLLTITCLYGCASVPKMDLNKNTNQIDISKKSLVLMIVTIENKFRHDVPISAKILHIKSKTSDNFYPFHFGENCNNYTGKYYQYIAGVQLPADRYEVFQIIGNTDGSSQIAINIPINLDFSVEPEEIVYLGNVKIILRKLNNDKEDTLLSPVVAVLSPMLGIIGKSLGLYDSTYDIIVNDNFSEDILFLHEKYPFLANFKIRKNILPVWIRPEEREGDQDH